MNDLFTQNSRLEGIMQNWKSSVRSLATEAHDLEMGSKQTESCARELQSRSNQLYQQFNTLNTKAEAHIAQSGENQSAHDKLLVNELRDIHAGLEDTSRQFRSLGSFVAPPIDPSIFDCKQILQQHSAHYQKHHHQQQQEHQHEQQEQHHNEHQQHPPHDHEQHHQHQQQPESHHHHEQHRQHQHRFEASPIDMSLFESEQAQNHPHNEHQQSDLHHHQHQQHGHQPCNQDQQHHQQHQHQYAFQQHQIEHEHHSHQEQEHQDQHQHHQEHEHYLHEHQQHDKTAPCKASSDQHHYHSSGHSHDAQGHSPSITSTAHAQTDQHGKPAVVWSNCGQCSRVGNSKRYRQNCMEPAWKKAPQPTACVQAAVTDVIIKEINGHGRYIVLANTSACRDDEIGCCVLQQKFRGHATIIFRFPPRCPLPTLGTITVWAGTHRPSCNNDDGPNVNFIFRELSCWGTGSEYTTTFCRPNGQVIAWQGGSSSCNDAVSDEADCEPMKPVAIIKNSFPRCPQQQQQRKSECIDVKAGHRFQPRVITSQGVDGKPMGGSIHIAPRACEQFMQLMNG